MPNRQVEQLAADYWDTFLTAHPTQGTALGDHRFDDRLEPIGESERSALAARLADLERRVGSASGSDLSDEESLSLSALEHLVRSEQSFLAADLPSFTVDHMNGPQVSFLNLPSLQGIKTPADGEALLARWHAMAPWLDAHADVLRAGAARGRTPIRIAVERTLSELDELLAQPLEAWPLLEPAHARPASWPAATWASFARAVEDVVRRDIAPAFARYRDVIAAELLPVARDEAHAGISGLPGGREHYDALVHAHTSTWQTAEELHAVGLAEIERIDGELAALGERVLGTRGLPATLAALRGDPRMYFSTRDEVRAVAERSLAAANAAIPGWFGRLPVTPCEVVVMARHEEEHSTIAYYREPAADGARPGRYYVNTFAPETRPRYEAEALAFHEAVPGHHLQIAIGQELSGLPTFRRHAEFTAFIEGWGLYSERLADEMGLYSGDLDRIGMLSYDAWRACRLVVDTGMHALGWSRSRAIGFMAEHSALAVNNITNEVDRYLVWPAQALAYKVGQLELRRLRADAEAALGSRFDVRAFHDAVLGHGPLPLGTMRKAVARDLGASV